MSFLYAKIAVSDLTYWLDRPYEYIIPEKFADLAKPGVRVSVPFSRNNRRAEGIILSISHSCEYEKPKSIISLLDDEPVLTNKQLELAFWMRERFFCTVYEAIKAILPAGMWFNSEGKRRSKDKSVEMLSLAICAEEAYELAMLKQSRAPMQAEVLRLLAAVGEATVSNIKEHTGASRATLNTLIKAEYIQSRFKEVLRRPSMKSVTHAELPVLNDEQEQAFSGLIELVGHNNAEAALLHGVTGSGKTAVYIRLIKHVLDTGKSVILLVPEIALTPQMLNTFASHFGDEVAVLHSSLSIGERYDEWKRVKTGSARLVIGTRSAVFAPCENLGLIIIDEEQEETYKSENSPRYHARDIAKYRCAENGALLLLGSATPDVESMYAAQSGRYSYFHLSERYNKLALPRVEIVDMKRELRRGNTSSISQLLREELERNIANNEQSILFINRRGASKLISCADCGFNYLCPNCSVNLTYHSANNRLLCHYCGHSRTPQDKCPECGGELRYIGDGTQKIEEYLRELFPDVSVLRMDTDTVAKAGSHEALLDRFRDEHIPIMIGTQMVTKGLNFDDVTLVGVLCADQSLYCGDYRASERTFSIITQVIGRSGRATRPGRAIIQTYTPDNQIIEFASKQDYEGFYKREIELRRALKSPPFTQIIQISVNGSDEHRVILCCRYIKDILQRELYGRPNTRILGPAPFPVVRVNNKFRYRISLASSADKDIRALISKILIFCNTAEEYRGLSIYGDMNPID